MLIRLQVVLRFLHSFHVHMPQIVTTHLNYQGMKTAQLHRRLGDIGRFEGRVSRFRTSINATFSRCVRREAFDEGETRLNDWIVLLETTHDRDVKALTARCDSFENQLNDRVFQLEKKHDAEVKTLIARCKRLEKELAAMREVKGQTESKATQVGPKPPGMGVPPQDSALLREFSGNDLETMNKGVRALKQWTGKTRAAIVFDSKKDPFTDQGLFDKVRGKANIALVAFTADGDVFGGFDSVAVTEQGKAFKDPDMFVFSFESHGRCETPKRFAVKEDKRRYKSVRYFKGNTNGFVDVGGSAGSFILGNEGTYTNCYELSRGFEGIEDNTLTGNTFPQNFTCTRIVAVHLN